MDGRGTFYLNVEQSRKELENMEASGQGEEGK